MRNRNLKYFFISNNIFYKLSAFWSFCNSKFIISDVNRPTEASAANRAGTVKYWTALYGAVRDGTVALIG